MVLSWWSVLLEVVRLLTGCFIRCPLVIIAGMIELRWSEWGWFVDCQQVRSPATHDHPLVPFQITYLRSSRLVGRIGWSRGRLIWIETVNQPYYC